MTSLSNSTSTYYNTTTILPSFVNTTMTLATTSSVNPTIIAASGTPTITNAPVQMSTFTSLIVVTPTSTVAASATSATKSSGVEARRRVGVVGVLVFGASLAFVGLGGW